MQSVQYKGKTYGVPWFINAEGVYYRTDLVLSPPKTPQQLVSDAKAAMKKDPSLKGGSRSRVTSTRAPSPRS